MQIQSIDNKSSVRFKSRNNLEKASAFVNMDDNQLKDLAYVMSYDKDSKKKTQKSLISMFYALPIIDMVTSGILVRKSPFGRRIIGKLINRSTKGNLPLNSEGIIEGLRTANLKNRVKAAGSTAGSWALWLSVIGVYNSIKKSMTSKSPDSKKFQQNNPIASFALDLGIIFAGTALVEKGLRKIMGHFPNAKKEFAIKTNKILGRLNKTHLNNDILPKLLEGTAKLSEKAPLAAKVGRFAIANSVWIAFGLGLLKLGHHQNHDQKKVEKKYKELKNAQFETAKHLNKVLQVERAVLAQNQLQLAAELRHEMNKTAAQQEEA